MDSSPPTVDPGIDDAVREPLNLKQVARHLGVHYMTVYRYVRHGTLPARREGPIWLVDLDDLDAFVAGRSSVTAVGVDWAARLQESLVVGDEVAAWTVVRDALGSGHDYASVHLQVIAGALGIVGVEVAAGRRTAMQERVAVATAWRVVARLGGQFPHRGRKLGTVVLALPEGEHHGLPLALVANLVRHGGFRVVELGTDTPACDVLEAVASLPDVVAVGLGVTTVARLDGARAVIGAIRAARPDIPVLLGGQAVRNREVAELAGASDWSAGGDLIEVLKAVIAAAPDVVTVPV